MIVVINMNKLSQVVYKNKNKEYIENCVIEEMSELTKAIIKDKRGLKDINNLEEEIGHVILMCNALMKCHGIPEYAICEEAEDAVNRMLLDIENNKSHELNKHYNKDI